MVLTARDGTLSATASRRLDPRTVDLTFESAPVPIALSVGTETQTAPFTRRVIQGSTVGVIAPTSETTGGKTYAFASWSDGGAADHTFVAPDSPTTYRATYTEAACPAPTGLVGAWGFDETSGTTVDRRVRPRQRRHDQRRHPDDRAGATASALTFDGVNDLVTVADSASLDLTNRATLEAWVNPTASFDWRTILLKEQTGHLVYALYANNDANRPSGHVYAGGDLYTNGSSALPVDTWAHVAMTWDGTTQRLYVNGAQVGTRAVAGTMPEQHGRAAVRRQQCLGRVVQRPDRRGPDLRPCAERGRGRAPT